jgi:cytoskeleton protein RodZ
METRTTAEPDRVAFGEFLRQARERRRLTLEQIAGETKIAPRLLTSLEQGDVQPMPKGMYRRAMLRAYAESVGLDTEAALSQFERTFEEPPPREVALPTLPVPPPTVRTGGRRRMPLPLAGVAAAAVAVAVLGAWALSGDAEPETPVQDAVTAAREAARPASTPATSTSVPATLRAVPATPTSAAATPGSSTPTSSAPRSTAIQAAARQPSAALEAAATSGTREVAGVTRAEETAPEPPLATEGRVVVLSDPAGARVTVNGVGWGSTPLTIRYLPLGEKRVRLTKPGYVSQERTVRVDGRRPEATLRVTLRERPE